MTETTKTAYDPIPKLALLLCAAQRLADGIDATGGVTTFARQLSEAMHLPELVNADEAGAAIRKAITGRQIDLTAPSESLTCVEILTPGGIVRVNTNLTDTRTGVPVVVVEVEPKTGSGEEWNVEVTDRLSRFDVRLVRVEPSPPAP